MASHTNTIQAISSAQPILLKGSTPRPMTLSCSQTRQHFARRQPPDYDRAISEYRKALAVDPSPEQSLPECRSVNTKGDKATARDALDNSQREPSSPVLPTLRQTLPRSDTPPTPEAVVNPHTPASVAWSFILECDC